MRRSFGFVAVALTLGCSSTTDPGGDDSSAPADAGSDASDTLPGHEDAPDRDATVDSSPPAEVGDAGLDSTSSETSDGGLDSAADAVATDTAADTAADDVTDSAGDAFTDSAAEAVATDSAVDVVTDSAADAVATDSAKCPIPAARYVGEDACGPPCVLSADTSCDGHAREIRCYRGSACFSAYTCDCYVDGASTGVSFSLASGYCTLSGASMWSKCGFP